MITFREKLTNGFTIDSPLRPFKFPGGETHITGAERLENYDVEYHLADLRGASSDDLFTLAMWADVLTISYKPTVLILPYLPGARADKEPTKGAFVYAQFLNDLYLDQIITLDPHSPYMPKLLSDLTVFPFERILRDAVSKKFNTMEVDHPYVGVIAPDKGAVDRATRAASALHVPVYLAGKTRDFTTGALTGFHMEDELPAEGKLLLVDDICDGGGTFNGLADAINIGQDRLDLWVTHGIFSKSYNGIEERFDHIYTTDSHPGSSQCSDDFITVMPVLPYLSGEINV